MRLLLLLFLGVTVLYGAPLTPEENAYLQSTCGKVPYVPRLSTLKSANTANATRTDAPFAVSIIATYTQDDMMHLSLCSGTLVSKRHVVTAAPCLRMRHENCVNKPTEIIPARYQVFPNTECPFPEGCAPSKNYTVTKYFYSPSYIPKQTVNGEWCTHVDVLGDVAVLKLLEDIDLSKRPEEFFPACLYPDRLQLGTDTWSFGYGAAR